MTERINKLRELTLNAVNRISTERAALLTDFYKSIENKGYSPAVTRALSFNYLLANKKINIIPDELIVGERGPEAKATPTYPEVSLHTRHDLEMLNSREKVSYKVDAESMDFYEKNIFPFWDGKCTRDKIMERVDQSWKDAYSAGVFTEFQEQRAPGHTVCGDKIYHQGMLDIIEEIKANIKKFGNYSGSDKTDRLEELKGMQIAAESIIMFAGRYADELAKMAEKESRDWRKKELLKMESVCRWVPAHAPRDFHEALQYYWFVHVGVITESNPWDSFNPGRLDQHLYPFYKKEVEEGTLDKEKAREILQSFWVKFNNHPAPPKVGVTALESSTYTDFSLINVGGLTAEGEDAANEMSFLILEVIKEMRLLQPSSMVQMSKKNPDELLMAALDIVKTGFGQPSIFNSDAIVLELMRQGKTAEDARRGGASGCVESGAFGTESYILTGYFNLVKVLEITLNNGVDPNSGKMIGVDSGNATDFKSFDDLLVAFRKQLNHFVDIKIAGNLIIEKIFAEELPVPFLSLVIDDCIANAKDYNAGGARYNTSYVQGVGLGSITDSLTSLKYHVFDKQTISMKGMMDALATNFENYPEFRHELIYNTPKYGNDDDYADNQAVEVFEMFFTAVDGRPTYRGGKFRINMLPTTSHVYFGSVTGAMPDGRKAKQPLSEGISPFQGADQHGPTPVLKSAAKIDHLRTGGTLLNQKFTPSFLENEDGRRKVMHLVRSWFRMMGHHIQFNVVDADTLRDAQEHPENYRDLIVRVAGYSDYFNDLGKDLQDEIIRRTAHGSE